MDRSHEFNEILIEKQNSYQIPSEPRFKKGKQSLILSKKPQVNKEEWISLTRGLRDLVQKITDMRNKLIANRRDYINLYGPLSPEPSKMTDLDRNRFDYEIHEFMKRCNGKLKGFRDILNSKAPLGTKETQEHFTLVLILVQAYLKSVTNIYTEQKTIRVNRALDRRKLSSLAAAFRNSPSLTALPIETHPAASSSSIPTSSRVTNDPVSINDNTNNPTITANHYPDDNNYSEEDKNYLSVEEIQLLKKENNVLYDEINGVNEEVETLTTKVEEIGRLQGIFAENILGQEEGLTSLSTTMISATENTREGNDEIREAIKKSAVSRFWALFIIILLAFVILFLDWFNP